MYLFTGTNSDCVGDTYFAPLDWYVPVDFPPNGVFIDACLEENCAKTGLVQRSKNSDDEVLHAVASCFGEGREERQDTMYS